MPSSQARLPRFTRSGVSVRPIHITDRDHQIIRHVARHRFLRSTHLCSLVEGNRQQLLRRLQYLFHHGYLERPRAQLDYYHRAGSSPIVYGLGSRGAAAMRRVFDMPFERMDWSGKNQSVSKLFLEHALLISDVLVSLELACACSGGRVRFFTTDELLQPASGKPISSASAWNVSLSRGRNLGLVPDAIFALQINDLATNDQRVIYFLEADRGTMPVVRSNPGLSSFARKLDAYAASWAQGVMQQRFGEARCRVLTVTTTTERARHLAEAASHLPRGKGLFLFTDASSLKGAAGLLKHDWLTADGARTGKLI